jgi:hypothetical protein
VRSTCPQCDVKSIGESELNALVVLLDDVDLVLSLDEVTLRAVVPPPDVPLVCFPIDAVSKLLANTSA